MQLFYDKTFLERAMAELVYDYGADRKPLKKNSGKSIVWNRFTPLAVATTALTEASFVTDLTAVDMTSTIVSATVADYGNYTRVGSLFNLTSIDVDLKEHVEVHGQNAGETIDTLISAQLSANTTVQLANAKSALTDLAATDTLDGAEIRKAVRTLKTNKGKRWPDGFYRGIVQPFTSYDLMGDTEWLDASRYTDTSKTIQPGLLGKLHGVQFVETNLGVTEGSSPTKYHNYICAHHGYGTVDLQGGERKIYVKMPNESSTENPLDLYSTVGWKQAFAAKVLNANWVVVVKTGATA